MKKTYEMDMINGPLLKNILQYAFPLMLSGILQLMFNAADVIVVGRFAGSQALAAVGSTGALCNLLINLFVGISIGTNVLVARYYGARDLDGIQETINTSIITAAAGGVALIFIGFFAPPPHTCEAPKKSRFPALRCTIFRQRRKSPWHQSRPCRTYPPFPFPNSGAGHLLYLWTITPSAPTFPCVFAENLQFFRTFSDIPPGWDAPCRRKRPHPTAGYPSNKPCPFPGRSVHRHRQWHRCEWFCPANGIAP